MECRPSRALTMLGQKRGLLLAYPDRCTGSNNIGLKVGRVDCRGRRPRDRRLQAQSRAAYCQTNVDELRAFARLMTRVTPSRRLGLSSRSLRALRLCDSLRERCPRRSTRLPAVVARPQYARAELAERVGAAEA